jgi:hypothetical protein
VTELGLVGAGFGTDAPLSLDDPAMDVLYAEAVRLDVPLSINPGPAGIDGPPGDAALKRFELDIIAGFAAQAWTTGQTPLQNLAAHLANPYETTVFSNDLARL